MEFSPEDSVGYKWLLGKVIADFGYCQQAESSRSTQMSCGILRIGGIQRWPNQCSDGCFDPGIGRSYVFAI